MTKKYYYSSGRAVFRSRPLFLGALFILLCIYVTRFPIQNNEISYNNTDNWLHYPQEDWQNVGHSNLTFWVYSAYSFEDQQVVIIGTPVPFAKGIKPTVQCAFHWSASDTTNPNENRPFVEKTAGKMAHMTGWTYKWAGTFVRCQLPNVAEPAIRPTFVSVLLGNQTYSPSRLPIQYRTQLRSNPPYKFSVCVLPLYGFNKVFHFLEWLEFYRMMGVEQFTFYNRSIGPAASCIMNHYKYSTNGDIQVTVNPWHDYPQRRDADIRFGVGLSAGANACLYSHKGISKYMIFVDVDEFIVPMLGIPDYSHLIEYLESSNDASARVGEYVFKNGFFLKDSDKDPELLDRCASVRDNFDEFHACQELWTMGYFQRENMSRWGSRSKYFALPEGVRNAGNHYVLEFENGWKGVKVPETVAFSRHYRRFKRGNSSYVERMPPEVGSELAKNVARSVKYFMNVCNLNATDVYN